MTATLTPTTREVRRLSRIITTTTWGIAAVVIVVSVSTTTRYVSEHGESGKVAPMVGLAVDAGFVVSLTADSTLSRYGIVLTSHWPRVMRWACGLISLSLNVGDAISHADYASVSVHAVSPLMLLLIGESGPAYRRALAGALRSVESAPETYPAPAPVPLSVPDVVERDDGRTDEYDAGAEEVRPDRTSVALPAELIRRARKLDEKSVKDTGKPASIRALRAELKVGQDRAKAVRLALGGAQ